MNLQIFRYDVKFVRNNRCFIYDMTVDICFVFSMAYVVARLFFLEILSTAVGDLV